MHEDVRAYLAEIGRRGGTRSRRALDPDTARAMVARREAARAAREFAQSPYATAVPALPAADLIATGLADLADSRETEEALLVAIGAPRLRLLGIRVPVSLPDAESRLFDRLVEAHGDGAHSRYNALIRRLVSFTRSAAIAGRAHA